MPKAPPEVIWSNHAVERGAERFGDCCSLTFPDEIIQAVACCKQVGDTFKVGQAGVIYVCVLASETQVLVKTVHSSESQGTLDGAAGDNKRLRSCRGASALRRRLDSRARDTRESVKLECRSYYVPGGSFRED